MRGRLYARQPGLKCGDCADSSRTATTAILGTSSCNSSSRFAPSRLPPKNVTPVTLPPGRLRLATRPILHRIVTDDEHYRDGRGGSLGRLQPQACWPTITATFRRDQIGGERRQPVQLIVRPALLDRDVASFDEPFLAQALAERRHEMRERRGGECCEETRPPASPAAARAPRAATPPPRRRAA